MNAPRTLMVMAGGTGGHIMPGLAVAGALRARGWNVVWMGNPDAMEGRLVPPQGIPMAPVRFSGVRGKGRPRCSSCRSRWPVPRPRRCRRCVAIVPTWCSAWAATWRCPAA